jgi:hypothetical protein
VRIFVPTLYCRNSVFSSLSFLSSLEFLPRSLAVVSSVNETISNDLSVSFLSALSALEQLELGGVDSFALGSRTALAALTSLKVLSLSFMSYILAEELLQNEVKELKGLKSLSLEGVSEGDGRLLQCSLCVVRRLFFVPCIVMMILPLLLCGCRLLLFLLPKVLPVLHLN